MALSSADIAQTTSSTIEPVPGIVAAAPTTTTTTRTVTGLVTSAGAITAGTGFAVSKTGTGTYSVTFTTAFTATPAVLLTLGPASAGQAYLAYLTANAASGFSVQTYLAGSIATDLAWVFTATGVT